MFNSKLNIDILGFHFEVLDILYIYIYICVCVCVLVGGHIQDCVTYKLDWNTNQSILKEFLQGLYFYIICCVLGISKLFLEGLIIRGDTLARFGNDNHLGPTQ